MQSKRCAPVGREIFRALLRACALVSLYSSVAAASPRASLTLDQVLTSTRRHHPMILQASYGVQEAEGKVLGRLGNFDPTIEAKGELTPYGDFETGTASARVRQRTGLWGLSLLGGWELGRGDFPIYKKDLATSDGGMALLGVELPLLRGGPVDKERAQLWTARHERDAARFRVAATKLELSRQSAHRYWDWVAAGKRLAIAGELLRIARSRIAQIAARVERGDLPRIDQIENQRAILKRQGAVVKARRAFEKAALKLSIFFRDAKGRPVVPLAEQLPASAIAAPALPSQRQLRDDVGHALAKRPELRVLSEGRKVASIVRRLAGNARLPKLDLSAVGSYDIGSEPYETQRVDVLLGLSFSFPLLVRAARGAVRAAEGTLGVIDMKTRLVADKIGTQVQDAYSAMRAARESLDIAIREVKVSHQVEEAERERLRLGASTLLLVNLRERGAAEAEFRAVDAAASLNRSLADYRAVTTREEESNERHSAIQGQ